MFNQDHWNKSQRKNNKNLNIANTNQLENQVPLVYLVRSSCDSHLHSLGYLESDYLELLDWAGRSFYPGKRGYIPHHVPPIVNRLGIEPENFIEYMQGKYPHLSLTHAIGRLEKLREYAHHIVLN